MDAIRYRMAGSRVPVAAGISQPWNSDAYLITLENELGPFTLQGSDTLKVRMNDLSSSIPKETHLTQSTAYMKSYMHGTIRGRVITPWSQLDLYRPGNSTYHSPLVRS